MHETCCENEPIIWLSGNGGVRIFIYYKDARAFRQLELAPLHATVFFLSRFMLM